jgi:hypothetical protein
MLRVRESWLKAFQDLGFSPKFLSSEQIEHGDLEHGYKVLVLPQSLAMSDAEVRAVDRFRSRGNIFGDGSPGLFDEHGKLRSSPLQLGFKQRNSEQISFSQSPTKTFARQADISRYTEERLNAKMEWAEWIRANLLQFKPELEVPLANCIRIHRFTIGETTLAALERNISYHMSEDLKQAGGNENLEKPVDSVVRLRTPAYVYDLRSGKSFGRTTEFTIRIDPWKPALLALQKESFSGRPAELVKQLLNTK